MKLNEAWKKLNKQARKKFGSMESFARAADIPSNKLQHWRRLVRQNDQSFVDEIKELWILMKHTDPETDDSILSKHERDYIFKTIKYEYGSVDKFVNEHPQFSRNGIYPIFYRDGITKTDYIIELLNILNYGKEKRSNARKG